MGILSRWSIPTPDVLITSVGSEIHYGRGRPVEDIAWRRLIDRDWNRVKLVEALAPVAGIRPQPKQHQRPFKLSYFVDSDQWPGAKEVRRRIRDVNARATVIYSHGEFLDLLPARASKGLAVKYLSERWGFRRDQVLVAGDSGNDALMLKTADHAVVVGNYSSELRRLRGRKGIYFAQSEYALGILEGISHFGFLDEAR
jgi:sucrose-phosphate synthase